MKFKLIKSKKGISIDFLVMAMVVIVGFVLLSFVLVRFMASFDDTEAEVLCHNSIALRGSTAINLGTEDSNLIEASIRPIPVSCRTIDVKIKGTRGEIIKKVTDKMARCWWMFGEGRYEEILHGSEVTMIPKLFGTQNLENKCFNCYTLTIDQNEIEGGPIGVGELLDYMFKTNYEPYNFSYVDYFQDFGGPGRFMTIAGTTEDGFIKARGAYAVSFGPRNHEVSGTFWGDVGKIAAGVLIVAVAVGGVVCIAATVGACGAAIAGGLGAVGVGAATATTIGTVTATVVVAGGYSTAAVVGGTGALVTYSGTNELLSKFYGERERSTIFLGWLEDGQAMCGSGDISGE